LVTVKLGETALAAAQLVLLACEAKWPQVLDVMSDGAVPRAVLRAVLEEDRPFG
jgi:hypothetical protein